MKKIVMAMGIASLLMATGCDDPTEPSADLTEAASVPEPAQQASDTGSGSTPPMPRRLDEYDIETFKVVYKHEGHEKGTSTLWVEDYGKRVAMEADVMSKVGTMEMPRRQRAYWDGQRLYSYDMVEDSRWDTVLRMKDMEPSAFAVTSEKDLKLVGYERVGDLTIAGKTCEHWRNEAINFEACRWKRVDLMSVNGALSDMTGGLVLAKEAVELVEGESIPPAFKELAN